MTLTYKFYNKTNKFYTQIHKVFDKKDLVNTLKMRIFYQGTNFLFQNEIIATLLHQCKI